MTTIDPYPFGQGDGLDNTEPPVLAFIEVDPADAVAAGNIPWPPYRHVEAPPCLASGRAPEAICIDGKARMFWCDKPAGHGGDEHRAVTSLDDGSALTWTGDKG